MTAYLHTTRECTTCAKWQCGRCRRVRRISVRLYEAEKEKVLRSYPQCSHCLSTLGTYVGIRHSEKLWREHNPGQPWIPLEAEQG